jgi:hypothetical protein
VEIDNAWGEFPDGRFLLPPNLSFREDRYHIALFQCDEQPPDFFGMEAIAVIFRR